MAYKVFVVGGGKVNEVAPDATAVSPSWRNSSIHLVLGSGWLTDTPFETRQFIRAGLTQETQKLAALVPGAGSYVNEYVQFLNLL
jgi:hypothetical protein